MTEEKNFQLLATEDRMAVVLDCYYAELELERLAGLIREELAAMGLLYIPENDEIISLIRQAPRQNDVIKEFNLLTGLPAVPSQNGRIEWTVDFASSTFLVDEKTGRVDFKRRTVDPVIGKEQLLATVYPPLEGTPGRDVFGRRLPVIKPMRAKVKVGPNVREERLEGMTCFYSNIDGRIRWAGDILAVDNVYRIDGDVNFKTGNIKHPGAVVVEGDVLAGFEIDADGDVEIRGVVEAAQVRAGGNLLIQGGITGDGCRSIHAAGNVHVLFTREVVIEALGNITVENEAMYSVLKARGAVVIRGKLIGGETSGLQGVMAEQTGSERHPPTIIKAGEDFYLPIEEGIIWRKIMMLDEELLKIRQATEPCIVRQTEMTEKQRNLLAELLTRGVKLEKNIYELNREIEENRTKSQTRAKPVVTVAGRMYPETKIFLQDATRLVMDLVSGPLQAILQSEKVELKAS